MKVLDTSTDRLDRRSFVRNGSLYLFGTGLGVSHASAVLADESKRKVRIGLVTDMHYADKKPAGSGHYRETLTKLDEAAKQFQRYQPDHVVELGDFIDAADSVEAEMGYLRRGDGCQTGRKQTRKTRRRGARKGVAKAG